MPARAELLATASSVLDELAPRFRTGLGAASSVAKGDNDFATELDLELERAIARELTARTGIGVHGEEFGGPALDSGQAWVVDPIDGTLNYSAGLPQCGMLLALVEDGRPVLGLTWLPLLDQRYAAVAGGPLLDGDTVLPKVAARSLSDSIVAFGPLDGKRLKIPTATRFALLQKLAQRASRVRMYGSTGVDLAYVAAGILGGAVEFSYQPWDNAAGAVLAQAAGAVVSDLYGKPWTIESDSILVAAPGVHDELVELVGELQ